MHNTSSFIAILCIALNLAACAVPVDTENADVTENVSESQAPVQYCNPVPASCSNNITGTADSLKTYSASTAVTYATSSYNIAYASAGGTNPFYDYAAASGGNCTNFISQALIAGLTGKMTPNDVYKERYRFDIDVSSAYQWYWHCDCDRGPAFTSPNKLYEYAKSNKVNYKGLHFQYITNDTLQTSLNVAAVKTGDVVFADFQHDGTMDHAMLVTGINNANSGYNKIRLTYQTSNTTNKGLGDINAQYNQQALFYVYRPVDYNPSGL